MTSNKIKFGLVVTAALLGGGAWQVVDLFHAHREVAVAVQEHADVEAEVKLAQAWLTARKTAAALITEAHAIEMENEVLRGEVPTLQANEIQIANQFVTAIEQVRKETLGVVLHELTLASGTVLREAKIVSVDSSIAVLQHTGGVSRVSTTILPEVLLDRLRLDYPLAGLPPGPLLAEKPASKTPPVAAAPKPLGTDVSDSLVRLGMDATIASRDEKKSAAQLRDPKRLKVRGDPGLWKSVERTAIGRAFIPGQGWLKVGVDGPIPGTGTAGIRQ